MKYSPSIPYLLVFFTFALSTVFAQQREVDRQPDYVIKGTVIEKDTYNPIPRVNVEINGGAYTITDSQGNFVIKANRGDELVVRHKDFETVFYTIVSDERITIKVESDQSSTDNTSQSKQVVTTYQQMIEAAMV